MDGMCPYFNWCLYILESTMRRIRLPDYCYRTVIFSAIELPEYQISDWRIRETIGLWDIRSRLQSIDCLIPDSEKMIGCPQCCRTGSGIRDEQPGSYFLELRNHFFAFLGLKYLNSLMRIRDGDSSDPGSGMEKSRMY
jgi:hypothetical protein